MNRIEFVELEQLQPDILVHAILRVVDITILTGKDFEPFLIFILLKINIQITMIYDLIAILYLSLNAEV